MDLVWFTFLKIVSVTPSRHIFEAVYKIQPRRAMDLYLKALSEACRNIKLRNSRNANIGTQKTMMKMMVGENAESRQKLIHQIHSTQISFLLVLSTNMTQQSTVN
jgi:hypothetical protein